MQKKIDGNFSNHTLNCLECHITHDMHKVRLPRKNMSSQHQLEQIQEMYAVFAGDIRCIKQAAFEKTKEGLILVELHLKKITESLRDFICSFFLRENIQLTII